MFQPSGLIRRDIYRRSLHAVLSAGAAALLLTTCGGDGSAPTPPVDRAALKSFGSTIAQAQGGSLVVLPDGSVLASGSVGVLNAPPPALIDYTPLAGSIVDIAADDFDTLLLRSDGTLLAGGENRNGQLGDGVGYQRPFYVPVLGNVKAIAAGYSMSFAIDSNGVLWAAGRNFQGSLGLPNAVPGTEDSYKSFTPVLTDVASITVAGGRAFAIRNDHSVWTTMSESIAPSIQVGNPAFAPVGTFRPIFQGAKAVAAGFQHVMVLALDGSLWAVGTNEGVFGDGTRTPAATFRRVFDHVVSVDTNGSSYPVGGPTSSSLFVGNTLVVRDDGTLWRAGTNPHPVFPACGPGLQEDLTFRQIGTGVASVVLGQHPAGPSIFMLSTDGTLRQQGLLGSTPTASGCSNGPQIVRMGVAQVKVSYGSYIGSFTTLLRLTSGDAIGAGPASAFGVGAAPSNALRPLATGARAVSASSGGETAGHWAILKSDGSLWMGGVGDAGQLGTAQFANSDAPVRVAEDVVGIALGSAHTLMIKLDKTLWSAGYGAFGQLGDGGTVNRADFRQVMTDVAGAAAGSKHSLALRSDGTLWAVGDNSVGQFGDGTNTSSLAFKQVLTNVKSVAAGSNFSLAVKNDGTLWATGRNFFGQLGDGASADRNAWAQVATGVVRVWAGEFTSWALKTDGTLWVAGYNEGGTFGNGSLVSSNQFVLVQSGVVGVASALSPSIMQTSDGAVWSSGAQSTTLGGYERTTTFAKILDRAAMPGQATP